MTDPTSLTARLRELLANIDELVGESRGVAGLHLNGDEARWDEILDGGRFERVFLEPARAALLAAAAPTPAAPVTVKQLLDGLRAIDANAEVELIYKLVGLVIGDNAAAAPRRRDSHEQ